MAAGVCRAADRVSGPDSSAGMILLSHAGGRGTAVRQTPAEKKTLRKRSGGREGAAKAQRSDSGKDVRDMAVPGKVLDNMTKHLTLAEAAARAEAEGELLTHVELSPDKPPALLKGDSAARRYWAAILGRMDNVLLLDSLDTEVMAIYCAMLSRRDKLQRTSRAKDLEPKDAAALSTELQKLEKSILSYAKDLGLTPAGRAQLARKRAAAVEVDPDADLYG